MTSSASADIVLIGAAGATGRALVRALLRRGARVRALVHRDAQTVLFPELQDVRAVELSDPAGLAVALKDAGVVHYIPPVFNSAEEEFGANVIAAAVQAGAPRLVYHSVLHAPTPTMAHHLRKSCVELALRESPLVWTIVQPAMYVQTPLAFLNGERTELNPGFSVTQSFNPIDIEDLSDAVAAVLTQDGHEFATYELAGAERLTFETMALAITNAIGTPVVARAVEPQQLVDRRAAARGFGPSAARELRAMFDHYDRHGLVGNGNVLRMLLGRTPIRFEDAVKRDMMPVSD